MVISESEMLGEHGVVQDGYVPVIDLSAAADPVGRASLARTIDEVCRRSGFLVIVGHGIDPDLVDRMHDTSLAFFELPSEVKRRSTPGGDEASIRGFIDAPSYVAASEVETAPDLCEMYTSNRLGEPGVAKPEVLGDDYASYGSPNIWPAEDLPGFQPVWEEYYAALEGLAEEMMRLFALALELPEDFFADKIDDHMTNLVANYYPPLAAEPLPGQWRKGPHSDWGTLTILHQDESGLQVYDRDGDQWLDVPVVEDAFVVNIGDLMEIWTNDRWRSTKHRVPAPTGEAATVTRVSIPFFHQPNWDALVECLPSCLEPGEDPRHPPVYSGPYILERVRLAYT
ncbi:MAG: 2OG-Fe(II) oxygenase family protein [Actinomycetota bacterium]